jgi:hypothetical protein
MQQFEPTLTAFGTLCGAAAAKVTRELHTRLSVKAKETNEPKVIRR